MPTTIYRRHFQKLASIRLREAEALLEAGRWQGAYYIVGYVVECSLKACIAGKTRRYEFPDKERAGKAWKHEPDKLVEAASIRTDLNISLQSDTQFASYWALIGGPAGWTEESRYRWDISEKEARDLYEAVADPAHGFLVWIKNHW